MLSISLPVLFSVLLAIIVSFFASDYINASTHHALLSIKNCNLYSVIKRAGYRKISKQQARLVVKILIGQKRTAVGMIGISTTLCAMYLKEDFRYIFASAQVCMQPTCIHAHLARTLNKNWNTATGCETTKLVLIYVPEIFVDWA